MVSILPRKAKGKISALAEQLFSFSGLVINYV